MTDAQKFQYITTTLPYVNGKPHIGFAMELVRADVLARWFESQGVQVFLNTGTDEHGVKLYNNAIEEGITAQEYVDRQSQPFKELIPQLNIKKDTTFIRTTNEHHKKAAQELWKRVNENGFIYKKNYQTKYCIGCELEKTDSELKNGECEFHPGKPITLIDEENYFFKFSEFGEKLLELYENNPQFVLPDFRLKEIKSFVEQGLQDFSISRLKTKMPWGVAVPGDEDHVMYVWFDALTNYISTLGWPEAEQDTFKDFWQNGSPIQYCGQDNLRQQSAMWQAMLMAANLPTSKQIIVNGFIQGAGGIKMSKSLGNVVTAEEVMNTYGAEATRYILLRHIHPFDGSPVSYESIDEQYHAHLANGLGNLVARTLGMVHKYGVQYQLAKTTPQEALKQFEEHFIARRYDLILDEIWSQISKADKYIASEEPYKVVKTNPKAAHKVLQDVVATIHTIALQISVFMPQTSQTILGYLQNYEKPSAPLFPRIEKE